MIHLIKSLVEGIGRVDLANLLLDYINEVKGACLRIIEGT